MSVQRLFNRIIRQVPTAVKMDGKALYENGRVFLFEVENRGTEFVLTVEDESDTEDQYEDQFYDEDEFFDLREHHICVSIEGEGDVDCSCPWFEEEKYCEHIVASLFYLAQHYSPQQSLFPKLDKPVNTFKQPLEILAPESNEFEAGDLLEPYIENFHNGHELYAQRIRILPDKLIAELVPEWGEPKAVQVTLEKTDDRCYKLFCSQPHSHKCDHINWMMGFIGDFHGNLFKMIRKEHFNETVTSLFKDSGIALKKGERPEDLIDVIFSNGDFCLEPKGKLNGLIKPETAGSILRENLLSQLEVDLEKKKSSFLKQVEKKDEKLAAFVFLLNTEAETLSKVVPISGKPNKDQTRIASYLEVLDSPHEDGLIYSGDIGRAFLLNGEVNALVSNKEALTAKDFSALHHFLETIKDECIYVSSGQGYAFQHYPPKKSDLKFISGIHTGAELKLIISKENDLYCLKAYINLPNGASIDLDKEELTMFGKALVVYKDHLILTRSLTEALALETFRDFPVIRSGDKKRHEFFTEVVEPIAKAFAIEFDKKTMKDIEHVAMQPVQKRLYISELNQFVIFRVVMTYEGDREVNVMEAGTLMERGDKHIVYERDVEAESNLLDMFIALHPSFNRNTQQGFFHLSHKEMQQDYWFIKAFGELKKHDVHVFGLNELKNFRFSPHPAVVSLSFKSDHDWFEANVSVAFGNNKVTTRELKRAIRAGNNYIELSDGSLGILPEEWLAKFSKLFRMAVSDKTSTKIAKTQFTLLDDLVDEHVNPHAFAEIEEKKQRLAAFSGLTEATPPAKLKATLRHYQQEGLNWLNFLREYGWGGILADDMGLGKTLQALALICLELEKNPGKTNLVVAPTTLLFNWKNEIEKFAPELDYFVHHGDRYDDAGELEKHQVVLSSYGVVVNDIDILEKIDFNLIIADESQAIKNLNAKRHKSVARLKGRLRLAMSGTPIENNIYELYAQMNFANPGFFNGLTAFKEDYVKPVERDNDAVIIGELRRKIKPFVLRRTKEQVLTELPDKTEEYIYCEMSAGQRKVYDAYRNEYRNYLLNKFEEEGLEKSQMYVLEGLTRLRQVCDSPLLLEKDELEEKASAKMDELIRHVQEKTGKHKILVFSQFVKMLKLVEERFTALDIAYEYLDGQTSLKKREEHVRRFQEDKDCRVFLISLKAGGTGLNLTAADYVYILDPWWNPAVEDQAIDRCYRMGQQKKVFAYRMICKDTVEEKIVNLQEKKKSLSEDIVGGGESMLKSLSREDIVALFS